MPDEEQQGGGAEGKLLMIGDRQGRQAGRGGGWQAVRWHVRVPVPVRVRVRVACCLKMYSL